jgi:MarR family transcriptional regulator, organic hydroperoxide resistance regulator
MPASDALAELAPLSHAIFRVARLHKMAAGQLLRGVGLYPSQELVMMRLWTAGPQRQVDLVRMLESEAPTMTRTIQRLEKAGLVRTSRSPEDRRSIIVEATEPSLSLRKGVEDAWKELEARTVGEWDEARRNEILAALTALESNLVGTESDDTGEVECA